MKRFAALVLVPLLLAPAGASATHEDPTHYVDPFIGTLGSGFVFPGPAAPYGMVQLSPDTDGYFAYTGYMWIDRAIRGFSHVHVQSMGVPEGGNLPFMPTVGPVLSTDAERYQSTFDHATEAASPGYYRVLLESYGVLAELTAGRRVGMHRYTFPPAPQANVLLDVGRQIAGGDGPLEDISPPTSRVPGAYLANVEIRPAERLVLGTANPTRTHPQGYAVHFAARFDRAFDSHGTWDARGAAVRPGTSVSGVGAGAVVSFDATADRDVTVEVGISFVSPENALLNLETELDGAHFDFDGLRARTRAAWDDALHAIEVGGGTLADKRSFYTALYHAQHHPNVFEDANGEYIGHDNLVHSIADPADPAYGAEHYYANYSLWDTYRAEKPLLMLIAPDRFRDFMRSWRAIVRWGGRLPRWSLMNRHADFMNGEPALQTLADAYCRGLVPGDALPELYGNARTLALTPAPPHRDPTFVTRGWVDPSATLEHALGNFALALVADRLGNTDDREALLRQAGYWRNVFDPETRFVRPRNADGSWRAPYDPMSSDGFTEGTGWQYTWLVPHDVRGVFDAIDPDPGDASVTERLDTFFSTALTGTVPFLMPEVQQKITLYGIAYHGNQYAPSNEHDLQAPWLHAWLGRPQKTQALARAYQGLYRAAPDGLPGNDDLGTMSAWYVWSALGFYPVIPGSPTYVIGSPVFERATIRLPDEDFTIEAPGASLAGKHVQNASLDGQPLARAWFSHDALADGGALRLEMGVPASDWAAGTTPPSQSASVLEDFACTP